MLQETIGSIFESFLQSVTSLIFGVYALVNRFIPNSCHTSTTPSPYLDGFIIPAIQIHDTRKNVNREKNQRLYAPI